jgi:hypothetical protein
MKKQSRRSFVATVTGVFFTGCINGNQGRESGDNESEEGEPEYVTTPSKDTLELPRDSLKVTVENVGDGRGSCSTSLRTYKVVDGERYIIAPLYSTLDAVLLEPGDEYTLTFTVDNTDRDAGGSPARGDYTLWGLNPGTYVSELVPDDGAEFEIVGEPLDVDSVSHEVVEKDGVVNVYEDAENLNDDEPAVRLTPTDADGNRLIEEQLNQFDALRDAVIYADGNQANIYTDYPPGSRLRFYTDEDLSDGPVVIKYDDHAYRVEMVG